VVRFVVVDATARYVMATGESLLGGFGHVSRWLVLLWFLAAFLKRHVSLLAKLAILGMAGHLVLPLPTAHSAAIWGLSSWVVGFAMIYWGRYRLVERCSKSLAVLMGACLAAAAILSKPDPVAMLAGALSPAWPVESGHYSPLLIFVAVLASATPPDGNLKYSAYVHEKGWRDISFLRTQRWDLLLSMSGMVVMLVAIQVAAAGALHTRGIVVDELEDLIPIFSEVLGPGGRIMLGVTLWTVVFTSYLGRSTAYGILFSDIYCRFGRRSTVIDRKGEAAGKMPAYRWVVLYIFLSPLYVFLTDWTPVGIVLMKAAFNLVLLAPVTMTILWLTGSKKIMGNHANTWSTNGVLILIVVTALYLTYQGGLELLATFEGGAS
jgi:Mn2+/Fe2+ NRAMP family transporter